MTTGAHATPQAAWGEAQVLSQALVQEILRRARALELEVAEAAGMETIQPGARQVLRDLARDLRARADALQVIEERR